MIWLVNKMVAGLVNAEYQSKILAEAGTLTTLEQKFIRLVNLETTDKSTYYLHSDMSSLMLSSLQRSEKKQQSHIVKDHTVTPYTKLCKGCEKCLGINQ